MSKQNKVKQQSPSKHGMYENDSQVCVQLQLSEWQRDLTQK